MNPPGNLAIVFFDGECALCNGAVRFLLKADRQKKLTFAPLSGKTAREILPEGSFRPETIIFYKNGKAYYYSEAVLKIAEELGGMWQTAMILKVLPLFIRNEGYKFVARNRKKWFGSETDCLCPDEELKGRLFT